MGFPATIANMSEMTLSDSFGRSPQPARETAIALTLVVQASDPTAPPARHLLDGVDEVVFGRGPRSATRDNVGGTRRLVIRIPDPFMSSDHGRLVRVQGRWMIEDPRSKNGVVVAGRATRVAPVETGDVLEVGHAVFLLESARTLPGAAGDSELVSSAWDHPLLASFHPDLEAGHAELRRFAPSTIPVLLHGETGTGKEVYASTLHDRSRRKGPFVAVNCGALTPTLLEAELFGHKRGAFSGATADRPGFVRSADGGTLFLDEITELSPAGQVALLRVLQEGEVVAVGDTQAVPVDVRVVAASQRPLLEDVEAGRFRSDLYARLLGHELHLPPLRERITDLGYLIASLLRRLSTEPVTLSPAAARAMIAYGWPRNIRELERCLASSLVLADRGKIDASHLPAAVRSGGPVRPTTAPADAMDPEDEALRTRLAAKLTEHRGNVSAVARDLDEHREQIQRWIRRFQLDVDGFRRGKPP
jgi:DNA-binding NtrC family response regulator